MNPKDFILLYITCKNKEEALKIGKTLVQEKLVACANIIDSMHSIYSWNNDIVEDSESILILKSIGLNFKFIELRIKEIHSYTNPCIVCYQMEEGSKEYLEWIFLSVRQQVL
jgi:periplasmic divalent cation tolerance protein